MRKESRIAVQSMVEEYKVELARARLISFWTNTISITIPTLQYNAHHDINLR